MNLVDDQAGSGGREHAAARLQIQVRGEGFRRRDHDMGVPAAHALALSCGRIARAHRARISTPRPCSCDHREDAGKRSAEDFSQRRLTACQWGDVDNLGLVPQRAVKSLVHQTVDCRHEGSQCFAGTGRGGNQHIAPGHDGGPGLGLRGRRPTEATLEPGGDGMMEQRRPTHGWEP